MGIMIALTAGMVFMALGVAMTTVFRNPVVNNSIGRTIISVLCVLGELIGKIRMPLFVVLISLIMIVLLFVFFRISVCIFGKKEL